MTTTTGMRDGPALRAARGEARAGWIRRYATSSIGKKQILALSGFLLIVFLIAHLAANLLVFRGPDALNGYSHALVTNPLIVPAEIGLAAVFLVHVGLAIRVSVENRRARGPVGYRMVRSRGRPSRRSFASQWMLLTGAWTLVFLVLHLLTFEFGPWYEARLSDGTAVRDLYRLVVETFQSPGYVGWYVLSMVALGLHLHHGVASLFETFGIHHPKWTPAILAGGKAFAWAMALGYMTIPVLIFLGVGVEAGGGRP